MPSTRMFPTIEAVPEDNMANGFTTSGSWVNSAPVPTPPQQRAPPSTTMPSSTTSSIKLVSPYTESQTPSFEPEAKFKLGSAPMHSTPTPQHLPTAEKPTAPFTHSLFPNELPPRPTSRPSLLTRVFHSAPESMRSPKHSPDAFRTQDIEMGRHGVSIHTGSSRKDDKYRGVKLGLWMVGGTVLCLMLGMMVYLVVMYTRDEHVRVPVPVKSY